jgi:hyperosmotically inducible protein
MKALLRAFLVIVLFVAIAFLALGYWGGSRFASRGTTSSAPVGTSGSANVEKARERGAEIGEKAAVAVKKVGDSMEEAALTTKIKAKMALDDSIKARAIDVTTDGSVVTLSGHVGSAAERDRAVALAHETSGVARVVDHLQIR